MNIFVAKLNPATSRDSIKQLFEQYGEVQFSKVVMDRDTGRSKCYGFVEMVNDDEAREAIRALDQSEFEGNRIVVKEAEPRENRPSQGGFRQDRERGGNNGGFRDRNSGNSGGYRQRDFE